MRVLTVYAHPNPKSFCHAILQQFTKGLEDAGHVSEVVDLYAIHFDPVFRMEDFAGYVHESMPPEILEEMNLKRYVLDAAGGPIQRFIAARWLRDKDDKAVARFIHAHRPKNVVAQWEKLEKALVITTTLFSEENYKAQLDAPMTRIIDDWGLRYPGVKNVEHVYFYGVGVVDAETRQGYLERAYKLGKEFTKA